MKKRFRRHGTRKRQAPKKLSPETREVLAEIDGHGDRLEDHLDRALEELAELHMLLQGVVRGRAYPAYDTYPED